ncbi:MAG: hypothetical protein JW849_11735 [Phycisphaerae bacterium]|nr:hypothetical protein [Phycisphaerae bacterium]
MATPMRNTSTSADETLLDTLAADHVSRIHRGALPLVPRDKVKESQTPKMPEMPEESPDSAVGVFESETPEPPAEAILEDSDTDDSSVEVAPPPPEVEINLAEEILSSQMAEEAQDETSEELDFDFLEEPAEAFDLPPDDEPVEIPPAPTTPAPVRPRSAIGAIRPPVQPSRFRSLLVQGIIVLLSLTAAALFAYFMGIWELKF